MLNRCSFIKKIPFLWPHLGPRGPAQRATWYHSAVQEQCPAMGVSSPLQTVCWFLLPGVRV